MCWFLFVGFCLPVLWMDLNLSLELEAFKVSSKRNNLNIWTFENSMQLQSNFFKMWHGFIANLDLLGAQRNHLQVLTYVCLKLWERTNRSWPQLITCNHVVCHGVTVQTTWISVALYRKWIYELFYLHFLTVGETNLSFPFYSLYIYFIPLGFHP